MMAVRRMSMLSHAHHHPHEAESFTAKVNKYKEESENEVLEASFFLSLSCD
jgi:hypothetical protein